MHDFDISCWWLVRPNKQTIGLKSAIDLSGRSQSFTNYINNKLHSLILPRRWKHEKNSNFFEIVWKKEVTVLEKKNLLWNWSWIRFPIDDTQNLLLVVHYRLSLKTKGTGKYFSEALILASTNPQSIWHENYKLRTCSVHKLFWLSKQKTICVHNMYWTCNSMNNLLSYCGLVDARISAFQKDSPVSCPGLRAHIATSRHTLGKKVGRRYGSRILIGQRKYPSWFDVYLILKQLLTVQ